MRVANAVAVGWSQGGELVGQVAALMQHHVSVIEGCVGDGQKSVLEMVSNGAVSSLAGLAAGTGFAVYLFSSARGKGLKM